MIKINFIERDGRVLELNATGHADYDEYGKDIVCSAVSAILTGGCNALENQKEYSILLSAGNLTIDTNNKITPHDEIVMRTMITQLQTIEESYKAFIKVSKKL